MYSKAERQSFQQFIRSKPGSTVLGELKPNASAKEVALLRDKIAKTIRSLEALDSISAELKDLEPMTNNECFIEVTKVSTQGPNQSQGFNQYWKI